MMFEQGDLPVRYPLPERDAGASSIFDPATLLLLAPATKPDVDEAATLLLLRPASDAAQHTGAATTVASRLLMPDEDAANGSRPTRPYRPLVFSRTQSGMREAQSPQRRLSLAARRLLLLIDGKRALADMPDEVCSLELPELLKELERQGMITLTSALDDTGEGDAGFVHPDLHLSRLKRALAGAFEAELGPQAIVLEARVQDCINLLVMRNVLREVISLVEVRRDAQAAERIAAIVEAHGPI